MTDAIENRPDMNTDAEWSKMDLLELGNCLRLNQPVEEIASFMCRTRREIRDKIAQLQQSGELSRWVEGTAKQAIWAKRTVSQSSGTSGRSERRKSAGGGPRSVAR